MEIVEEGVFARIKASYDHECRDPWADHLLFPELDTFEFDRRLPCIVEYDLEAPIGGDDQSKGVYPAILKPDGEDRDRLILRSPSVGGKREEACDGQSADSLDGGVCTLGDAATVAAEIGAIHSVSPLLARPREHEFIFGGDLGRPGSHTGLLVDVASEHLVRGPL